MWTPATRAQHRRDHLRYSSDPTDAEWALIEPVLPKRAMTGRPRVWPMREIVNAVLSILRSGCSWRMLPDHFPPRGTVWDWFRRFGDECLFEGLGHRLVLADRERCGRQASPSAAVMDSQTARTCESGGPRGYDGAKRIVGRKRHALVDSPSDAWREHGRLLTVVVGAASVQDRDGAGPLARASRHRFPFVERIFAD